MPKKDTRIEQMEANKSFSDFNWPKVLPVTSKLFALDIVPYVPEEEDKEDKENKENVD